MPSVELTAPSNGITLTYQTFGNPADAPLLLVAGIGSQMLSWPDGLCQTFAEAGFFTVRFDNRDTGRSTWMTDAPEADLKAARGGDFSSATYTLDDLADDAVGLLDHLRIGQAHVMGASMGGMIAQTVAVRYPHRVRSLTSVYSTPAPAVGAGSHEAFAVLMAPAPTTRAEAGERAVSATAAYGSTAFAQDVEALRLGAEKAFDRGVDPRAKSRHMLALWAGGDRTEQLRSITAPTLVVHGSIDPLITPDGGRATAEAIDGAELLVIEGMGHDLPPGVWPLLVEGLEKLAARAS